jgi:photosystem II stability/assembly factor-like uncharacterized protein
MKTLLLSFLLLASPIINAQSTWMPTNSPQRDRYDDISFISPDTGWAVGSSVGEGRIYHTVNGGNTWNVQKIAGSYMRSIEFADKNIGFAGALGTSNQGVFFKTTNGGATWTDISSVVTGTNRGICGICCVNTSITYAVGVWSSPSYVMKTIDGGNTWTQINMGAYANRLVDVQFTDANNGYVSGQSNINSEGAVVLKTTDGGISWTKVFTSNIAGEYVWKLQNLDGQNWFGSVEASVAFFNDSINNVFIKSTDSGNTWISKPVGYSTYLQAIGFMDTQHGWTGGSQLFETSNGGNSWTKIATGQPYDTFDRFQKVNNNIAYLSSSIIYKLDNTVTSVKEVAPRNLPKWLSVYPNPAKEEISYQLALPNKTMFGVRVFNAKQELMWESVDEKGKGVYTFRIAKKLPPGIYFVYVMFNEHAEYEKVMIE